MRKTSLPGSQQLHDPAPWVPGASRPRSTPGPRGFALIFRFPAYSRGSFRAMAVKRSRTFSAVFADVSKNSRPASLTYASASAVVMVRLSRCSATRSALFPARAMLMFSFACLYSSLTQAFVLSKDDCGAISFTRFGRAAFAYGLCDIIDDDGVVGVSVVLRAKDLYLS